MHAVGHSYRLGSRERKKMIVAQYTNENAWHTSDYIVIKNNTNDETRKKLVPVSFLACKEDNCQSHKNIN